MWIPDGMYLAYYYLDPEAGPSAKGARVSDSPTPAEFDVVIQRPDATFRDPVGCGARTLTAEEVVAAELPDRPPWLEIFEPPGTSPPPIPRTAETGRPPGIGTTFMLQFAGGPHSGGFRYVNPGEILDVGCMLPEDGPRRVVVFGSDVREQHAVISNVVALTIEPSAGAKVVVNGTQIAAVTRLAIGDRIEIGENTLIIRAEVFDVPFSPDPSSGVDHAVFIWDGCSMFGGSSTWLIGGGEMIIGTDTPQRVGLPKSMYMAPPVRVRLFNNHGKVEFSTLDPARLPKVRGRPLASGTLQVGDTIEVGDRVFGVGGSESSELFPDTPLPMCPEARVKPTLATDRFSAAAFRSAQDPSTRAHELEQHLAERLRGLRDQGAVETRLRELVSALDMLGHRLLPVPGDPSTWFGVTSQLEPCSLYISCGIDEETDEPFAIVSFGKHQSCPD
jgi:hypothetical protein